MGCTDSKVYDISNPSYTNGNKFTTPLPPDQRKKHNLSEMEILDMYEKSQGSLEKFFHLLSERVTEFYDDLSSEVLELLNAHKVTTNQSKVLISEQVLIMALDVLQAIGKKINFSYSIDTFHYFNRAQSNLLGYLKMKYPRAGNVFVSSDLSQKFKSFDFVQNPRNDILSKFNIHFTNKSQASIIEQVKIFFNALMEELDEKFPVFKNLMEDHVFKYYEGQGEHKKAKILNYKIGRKIPENTSKFVVGDSEELTISSPEIFRTIVKWVEDLEDWFKSPGDQISSRETFKVYKTTKTGNIHTTISKDEIDELPTLLKNKIKQKLTAYDDKLKQLRKQMDIFNINLLKILYTTERKQKYVPLRQAKIIKYAMLNTKIVSWMLAEMLIYILQKLVEVGQDMEDTKVRKKMDLIKFTVTDLMRAQVVGNKKQILSVYSNIEKLQKNNDINIIKIKNRLGTSLNDAMIIFTIKQSKLICELQLILSQGGSEIERLKNIQFLNHMLYELERSPYGVLSEIAVILGYKDSKINFQSKIRFEKNSEAHFQVCKKNHQIKTEKVQKKPFLCIQCTQFYLPFENIFDYHYCKNCYSFQCCKCAFAIDQKLQQKQIHERYKAQLQSSFFTIKLKPKIPKQINLQKLMRRIYPQKVFFKNIFPRKAYYEIKPKDFINFIKNKEYIKATGNQELEKMEHLYFLLVQFRGAETNLNLYYWNQNQMEIQNCYDSSEVFSDLKKVSTSYYDFITFFKSTQIQKIESTASSKYTRLCLKPEQQIQNIKRYRYLSLSQKYNVILVLKVEVSKGSANVDGLDVEEKLLVQKKEFLYESLEDVRKTLPEIQSVREYFQMKNVGITSVHLEYFRTCQEKLKIKSVNLSDNKIVNISPITQNCLNLQQLIISKNFIKTLSLSSPLPSLTKLIAYGNFITSISNLQKAPNLQILNLQSNKLKNLQSLQLSALKEFNIANNKFNNLAWVEASKLPALEILGLGSSGISQYGVDSDLDFSLDFPMLQELNFSCNLANKLIIKADRLTFLDCSNCSIKHLSLTSRKVQILKLQKNQIENLQKILQNRLPQLKQLLCDDAGNIGILPQLDDVEVVKLDLSNCGLSDVGNLGRSSLIKIQEMVLDGNQGVKALPSLKFQNLRRFSIKDVHLNDLSFVQNSTLPLLDQLQITGQPSTAPQNWLICPTFKLPKLKKLTLKSISFSSMDKLSSSQFSALQQLTFSSLNSKNFPTLILPTLKRLSFVECSVENVQGIHRSQFRVLENLNIQGFNQVDDGDGKGDGNGDGRDGLVFSQERRLQRIKSQNLTKLQVKRSPGVNLQTLFRFKPVLQYFNATDNNLKIFPTMQLKNVKTLDFSDCQVQNIANLALCKLQALQKLNLSNNHIKAVPEMRMSKLRHLVLENNQIWDVREFEKSVLPGLEFIDFDRNQLKQFPTLKFPNLKQIQIGDNPILSLTNLQNCKLSSLQKLLLKDCKKLTNRTFPTISLQKCKSIKIIQCNLDNLDNLENSYLPQLTYLQVLNVPVRKLPVLRLQAVKTVKVEVEKEGKVGSMGADQQALHRLEDISNLSRWECPKIQHLYLQNSHATTLPKITLQNLQTLDLQGSNITNITQFKDSILPSLAQINLSNNKNLKTMSFPNSIEHVMFNGCNFQVLVSECLEDAPCKSIQLSRNRMTEICQVNAMQLEYLNLYDNRLVDISAVFRESPQKLKNLNLKSNLIKSLPQLNFPELNYLHISQNKIQTLRIKKKNFPSLIGLYAQNNLITSVSTLDIPTLTSINLNKNNLPEINFFNQQYLQTKQMKIANLRLEENGVKSILYLPNVSNVYLRKNLLENLDWLVNCQGDFLAVLAVGDNRIGNLDGFQKSGGNGGKVTKAGGDSARDQNKTTFNVLSEIDLSGNGLKQFTIKNVRFPSLDTLNLSQNQLQKFPQLPQSTFPNLQKLNLSNNKISQLPLSSKFNKLRTLDLSNNKLSSLNTKQLIFKQLKQLSFADNLIEKLQGLENIRGNKLEKLNLASNLFGKLVEVSQFGALREFNVDKNQIGEFQGFLGSKINDWGKLKFIYLIRKDIPEKTKEEIRRAIHKKIPQSQCRNLQLAAQTRSRNTKLTKQKQQKQRINELLSLN